MINPQITEPENIEFLKEEFLNYNYVEIYDFLEKEKAEEIFEWYENKMNSGWWENHTLSGSLLYDELNKIELNSLIAKQTLNENKFSYLYSTSSTHYENCSCFECQQIKTFFASKEIINLINIITDQNYSTVKKFNCMRLQAGNFITKNNEIYHNNALQFDYCLTKKWSLNWGGLKLILDENDNIEYEEFPNYNRLILRGHKELNKYNLITPIGEKIVSNQYNLSGFFE